MAETSAVVERVESRILIIRGKRVMLDADLAELYGVTTKRLNEQVRRNRERFPADFMFCLTREEVSHLRSQFATSSPGHGGRRTAPLAFTEHGALMLASVLNSTTAVAASIHVVRAFVRLRALLATHADLARKIKELETRYDSQFKVVFEAIEELMQPEEPARPQIGFRLPEALGS
ncbi:MAG: ORF6N domain-containing protein [Deltaproteobacteria bacterium]|nr:ORF6N domain-containing protein [Deltaproteobacteria bacterium]